MAMVLIETFYDISRDQGAMWTMWCGAVRGEGNEI